MFMRILSEPLGLALDSPRLTPLQIAFYRGLFGGIVMLAMVRRAEIRFRPSMIGLVVAFSLMSALYLSALGLGAAANAIFLQNTAPVWVYLFAVFFLRESVDRRGLQAVLLATLGAVVIVAGGWPRNLPPDESRDAVAVLFMGIGSGMLYAVVVLLLRSLRDFAPAWLIALGLLGTAATLGMLVLAGEGFAGLLAWASEPSPRQMAVLALFGACQLALPYWLFTRGLRSVSPQEAAIITLIEPLLNPLWAFLISPEKDSPTGPMVVGGGLILFALVWRYSPARIPSRVPSRSE